MNHGLNVRTQPEIQDKQPDTTQSTPLSPQQDNSTSIEEGEDVDNHFQPKTSRREIILQSLRRSKRLNPTGINSQSIAGSQPDNDETQASVVSLQLNNLIEGKLISKDLYNINDIDKNDLKTNIEDLSLIHI